MAIANKNCDDDAIHGATFCCLWGDGMQLFVGKRGSLDWVVFESKALHFGKMHCEALMTFPSL
jgi:hypothetical protein